MGFQTPPDRRAVMTVRTDGYETRWKVDMIKMGPNDMFGVVWAIGTHFYFIHFVYYDTK